jgi:uncharacterized cofD-like protein
MGGGTGLSTLLRGLKRSILPIQGFAIKKNAPALPVISDLTAIVAMTDDGGSSGRLRRDFNMLPPGDLRNCMVALCEDDSYLSRLFCHRFRAHGELGGHNVGNLFITALAEMTGDFSHAVRIASEMLAVKGRILPVSSTKSVLVARMEDGAVIRGETNISAYHGRIAEVMLDPPAPASPEVLAAIASADLVALGPGSLYTSLITNLMVDGVSEALASTSATRIYIANLMTEPYESIHLSASEHIERIYAHAGKPIFDYAIVNTGPVSETARLTSAIPGGEPVIADIQRIEAMGIQCITGDFAAAGKLLRHDPPLVAQTLLALARRSPQKCPHCAIPFQEGFPDVSVACK